MEAPKAIHNYFTRQRRTNEDAGVIVDLSHVRGGVVVCAVEGMYGGTKWSTRSRALFFRLRREHVLSDGTCLL